MQVTGMSQMTSARYTTSDASAVLQVLVVADRVYMSLLCLQNSSSVAVSFISLADLAAHMSVGSPGCLPILREARSKTVNWRPTLSQLISTIRSEFRQHLQLAAGFAGNDSP